MSIPAAVIVALLLVIVAPIWIVAHYATRWRTARMMSKEQERVLSDLWELAQGMERRVESLETILDSEAPGWRGRAQAKVDPWKETRQ
ncbi:MAG: envelope stress response membrane protein PspB [Acetobacteraceae bacterium]